MCLSSFWRIRTSPISTVDTTGAWSTRTPSSPSAILATTRSASPSKTTSSGVMIRQKSWRLSRPSSRFCAKLAHLAGLADLPGGGGLLILVRPVRPLGFGFAGRRLVLAADPTRFFDCLVYVAHEVEGLLRQVVVTALHDLLERADRVLELHELAR